MSLNDEAGIILRALEREREGKMMYIPIFYYCKVYVFTHTYLDD